MTDTFLIDISSTYKVKFLGNEKRERRYISYQVSKPWFLDPKNSDLKRLMIAEFLNAWEEVENLS